MDEKIPYLKWGSFRSRDIRMPDIISWEVVSIETFETPYATCVRAKINGMLLNVPLHWHDSANRLLLLFWNQAVSADKIKKGVKFKLKTWMGTSKRFKSRAMRRFEFLF